MTYREPIHIKEYEDKICFERDIKGEDKQVCFTKEELQLKIPDKLLNEDGTPTNELMRYSEGTHRFYEGILRLLQLKGSKGF